MKALGEDLAAVANQASQVMDESPFIANASAVAVINVSANWNGTVKVQGSDDDSTWSDLATVTGTNQASEMVGITLKKYMRASVTAYTAGEASCYLLNE